MTRDTPRSTRDARIRGPALRAGLLALALIAATALVGSALAGTAAAQSDGPTVRITDATTAPDGTTTVDVVLTDAADGLAGYYLEFAVADGAVGEIRAAGYPETFALTSDPVIGADNRTVRLEAADIEDTVEPGASRVTLATVKLAGATSGETDLSVESLQFDADDGAAMQPATRLGRLVVSGDGSGDGAPGNADGGADGDGLNPNGTATGSVSSGSFGLLPVGLALAVAAVCALSVARRRDSGRA